MKKLTLEDAVRGILSEQKYNPLKQWEKEKKPEIDIGAPSHDPFNPHAHDPSGPNKTHIEEDMPGSQFGMRHNPKKHPYKKSLGALEKRNWGGNQRRKPSTYNEEVKEKFKKKLSQKNNEKVLGKTATGQQGETIDTEPNKPEFTGFQ